jgi:hypothetical protein
VPRRRGCERSDLLVLPVMQPGYVNSYQVLLAQGSEDK